MTNFDYKKFLAESKATFFTKLNENASNVAEKFAQHMSKKEGKKFTVTPGSVDEKSFDLDVDGEKYMGGSYLVKDNGDIVNVAMGNKVSGNVNQLEEGDLMKNIGKGLDYESTEEMIRDYASGLFGDTYEPEDLADFYLQNPSAFPKSLDHEFFKNNYDDILSLAMTGLDEGKAAYEYEEGKKAGEAIEKKKMKKSELKAKIKEMIVAEQEDEEEAEVEATDDVTTGDEEIDTTVDVSTDDVDPNVKAVQDALTQAQASAQDLGDPKLSDQIGNTITFFTRSHVVKKPGGAVTENQMGSDDEIGYEYFFKVEGEIDGSNIDKVKRKGAELAKMLKQQGKISDMNSFFRGFMDSWRESGYDETADKEDMYESKKISKRVYVLNVKENFKIKVYEHTRIKRTIRCFV
jgi:hypothetical protein